MFGYRGIIKEHASLFNALLHVLDWVVIAAIACFAHWFYLGSWWLSGQYAEATGIAVLMAAWVLPKFGLYEPWRGASIFEETKRVFLAWATVIFLLLALAFSTKTGAEYSRGWLALWAVSGCAGLILERIVLRMSLRWLRHAGFNLRGIVIVGASELGCRVAERIARSPWAGLEVLGFFLVEGERACVSPSPVLGGLDDLASYVERKKVDQVWIAMALRDEDKVGQILNSLRHCTVDIRFVPDIFGFRLLNHSVTQVAGLPVLNLSTTPMAGANRVLKELEDTILAATILVLVSPLMLLLALGVRLSSPGPVLYRQERVGWNGRPFLMLKFRSMPVDAEETSGPIWAKPTEHRATTFGAFLRATSLDELPQLINVLRGDMSIVGPRPERPVFVERFKDEIPDYMKKHMVKAGITGWAQVNGWRGDTDLAKRIEHDLYYIDHWSLGLDIKIILLTLFKGFVHRNAY